MIFASKTAGIWHSVASLAVGILFLVGALGEEPRWAFLVPAVVLGYLAKQRRQKQIQKLMAQLASRLGLHYWGEHRRRLGNRPDTGVILLLSIVSLLVFLPLVILLSRAWLALLGVGAAAHLAQKHRQERAAPLPPLLGLQYGPGHTHQLETASFPDVGQSDPSSVSEPPSGPLAAVPFLFFERYPGVVSHFLTGRWHGLDVVVFDYAWSDSSYTYHQSCALTTIPVSCPRVSMSPHRVPTAFDFIYRLLGIRHIKLGWEPFDRAYLVQSDDEQFARQLLDWRMQEWLLSVGRRWSFEICHDRVLCLAHDSDLVENAEEVLQYLKAFREGLTTRLPGRGQVPTNEF